MSSSMDVLQQKHMVYSCPHSSCQTMQPLIRDGDDGLRQCWTRMICPTCAANQGSLDAHFDDIDCTVTTVPWVSCNFDEVQYTCVNVFCLEVLTLTQDDSYQLWESFSKMLCSSCSAHYGFVEDFTEAGAPTAFRQSDEGVGPWTCECTPSINWGSSFELHEHQKECDRRPSSHSPSLPQGLLLSSFPPSLPTSLSSYFPSSLLPSQAPDPLSSFPPTLLPSQAPSSLMSQAPTRFPSLPPGLLLPGQSPSETPSLPSSLPPSPPSSQALIRLPGLPPGLLLPGQSPSGAPSPAPSLPPRGAPSLQSSQALVRLPSLPPGLLLPGQSPSEAPSLPPSLHIQLPSLLPGLLLPDQAQSLPPSLPPNQAPSQAPSLPSILPRSQTPGQPSRSPPFHGRCHKCEKFFRTLRALEHHRPCSGEGVPRPEGIWRCKCGDYFVNEGQLKDHEMACIFGGLPV